MHVLKKGFCIHNTLFAVTGCKKKKRIYVNQYLIFFCMIPYQQVLYISSMLFIKIIRDVNISFFFPFSFSLETRESDMFKHIAVRGKGQFRFFRIFVESFNNRLDILYWPGTIWCIVGRLLYVRNIKTWSGKWEDGIVQILKTKNTSDERD